MRNIVFLLLGILFGIVMYKAEAASWFRIFEMFNFDSIHMYGFIGSALLVGIAGVQLLKKSKARDIDGREIVLKDKNKSIARYLIGGVLFGLGWALVGVCPGPLFVLIGSGLMSITIVILSALAGTYLYGILRKFLPH